VIHGTEGHLTTSPMTERPEACQAIVRAAQELGLEYRPDVNNLPRGAGDSIGGVSRPGAGAGAPALPSRTSARQKGAQICRSSPTL
jgi:hypothetical protein